MYSVIIYSTNSLHWYLSKSKASARQPFPPPATAFIFHRYDLRSCWKSFFAPGRVCAGLGCCLVPPFCTPAHTGKRTGQQPSHWAKLCSKQLPHPIPMNTPYPLPPVLSGIWLVSLPPQKHKSNTWQPRVCFLSSGWMIHISPSSYELLTKLLHIPLTGNAEGSMSMVG